MINPLLLLMISSVQHVQQTVSEQHLFQFLVWLDGPKLENYNSIFTFSSSVVV